MTICIKLRVNMKLIHYLTIGKILNSLPITLNYIEKILYCNPLIHYKTFMSCILVLIVVAMPAAQKNTDSQKILRSLPTMPEEPP